MSTYISIILCTYNRAECLATTLSDFSRVRVPEGGQWELLVIDNNSGDETARVCEEYRQSLPLRYLFEPRQGKSNALNLGVTEAKGDLLLFTDDDVRIDPDWLTAYSEAAQRRVEIDFFAGRIFPLLEGAAPKWFAEQSRLLLANLTLYFDPGEEERSMESAVGANMAIRKSAFDCGVSFRSDLGPDGTETMRSEENELLRQMCARGLRGSYVPSARVEHRTFAHRMTERYVRKWFYGEGIAQVRRGHINMVKPIFGVPRYLWRRLLESASRYALCRWWAPSSIWLQQEIYMAQTFGNIRECITSARMGSLR